MKYRERILESVTALSVAYHDILSSIINISAEGEMKEYLDDFEEGTVINFDIEMFTDSNDQTVKLLIEQYKNLISVTESIININALSKEELSSYLDKANSIISDLEKKQRMQEIYLLKKKSAIIMKEQIIGYASLLADIDECTIDAVSNDEASIGHLRMNADSNLKSLLKSFDADCKFLIDLRKKYNIKDDDFSIDWNIGNDDDDQLEY